MRKPLALLCALWTTGSASALTPGQELLLLGNGGLKFLYKCDYTASTFCGETYSSTSQRTRVDQTGATTSAPNNILLNSATLSTQSVTVSPTWSYMLSFSGTGSVTLSGAASGTLNGTGVSNQVSLKVPAPSAGSLTLTVSGSVTSAALAAVTYETSPRTIDQVATTGTAYFGPAFDYNPISLAPLGIRQEEPRTNVILFNRDLTNAAWVETNATVAKNATGIDTVANSASTITATAANATVLQSITLGSSARFQSAYVKRVSGSGEIDMTTDGGATWTNITAYLNSTNWMRNTIPGQTLANPTVGFRLVTSGDAISVDGVQNETGTVATSVLYTAASSVARSTEYVSFTGPALSALQASAGTLVVETGSNPFVAGGGVRIIGGGSADCIPCLSGSNTQQFSLYNGSSIVSQFYGLFMDMRFTIGGRTVVSWSPTGRSGTGNSGSVIKDANKYTSRTFYNLGSAGNGSAGSLDGWVRSVTIYNKSVSDATQYAMGQYVTSFPTIVDWGDSLTQGNQDGTGVTYSSVLFALEGQTHTVFNEGINGQTSTQILARLQATPWLWGRDTVIWAGRNDFSVPSVPIANISSMVALLTTSNYLDLSIINGEGESTGTANYNNIATINASLSSTYGTHYLDVRSMLVASYDSTVAPDVIDHTNDTPPFSLHAKYPATITTAITTTSQCSFSISLPIIPNEIITIGSEYIYVTTASGNSVTGCMRGYASSTASTYANSTALTFADNVHLNAAGYTLVATWIATRIAALGGW